MKEIMKEIKMQDIKISQALGYLRQYATAQEAMHAGANEQIDNQQWREVERLFRKEYK